MTHNRIRTSDLKHHAALLFRVLVLASILLAALGAPLNQAKAASAPVVFRVDSKGNITANGVAIRIKGGSWFGLQGRHEPSTDATNPSGAPMEQYMGNVFWNSTTRTYDQDIAEFKAMGINVIRLPLVPQTLTGTDPQGMAPYLKNTESVRIANSRLALETVIKKLDAAGIYVLLDIHSCSNYVDWRKGRLDARPPYVDATRDNYDFKREDSSCSATNNPASVTRIQAYDETKWLADLQTLASLESSLGVTNIIGIDIFNEPWDYTWSDWSTLAGKAYTTINAVNPNILIFMEGISDSANNQDGIAGNEVVSPSGSAPAPNWGGNLYSAGANPPAIPKDRLVYSPHVYGPSVFVGKQFVDNTVPACVGLSGDAAGDAKCPLIMPSAATLAAGWDSQFGYLKAQGYAIVIGEWGGNMDWPKGKASLRDQARFSYVTDTTLDQQWQNIFVDYLISKGIYDTIYWSINPESGDTGGLYTTPYDPVSNPSGWGTWGELDSRKMTLVHRLWDVEPNPGSQWLKVSGRHIQDSLGNNVILRGVSLTDVSVADANTRNARQLIDMATNAADGWYARVVRLPVYPNAIDHQPGWIAGPDAYFNNHLDPAVQECIAKNIYCIIDWHYIADYNNSTVDTATRAFWNYVAPKYADVPNVIFELYNEPVNPDNWSTWKQWAQPWVDIIRSHAPNNLILIGGPRWSQNLSSAASDPFTGSNLVYVAHIYPEHGGQSTWDSWFGNAANSVPFFVTEWGWQQGGDSPTSGTLSGYGIPFSNYLESKGLSWTAWVFDNYWQPVMWDVNWNLLGGEAYMGEYTKQLLGGNNPTPTVTVTPTVTITPTVTVTPTTPPPGNLKVQAAANGTDNNQQTGFRFRVQNSGSSALSNISTRIYFTLDGSNAASSYVLEKYYDQSGAATISGPTQLSGSTYYFTVSYGSTALAAGGSWEFQTALHLNTWASTFSSTNDFWHTTNTLPSSYTDWTTIPAYLNGSKVWGNEPGDGPTPTVTVTPTTVTPTTTVTVTPTTVTPTTTVTVTPTPPGTCQVTYTVSSQWGNGFNADVTIKNNGSAINAWTLTWAFPGNQNISNAWNTTATQSGKNVSAVNASYNGSIPSGGTASFGFQATYSGTNNPPVSFALNGVTCGDVTPTVTVTPTTVTPTTTVTVTPTTVTPTTTVTVTPTTVTPTTTVTVTVTPTDPPGTHLSNPFVGASFYKNVDYVASVNAAADAKGGSLGAQMRLVANYPTFVWLDSIDAVNGTNGYPRSLAGHLDAALAQGANAIGIVIYDLPNRDCSALASNGELLIANNGLAIYKTQYIDAIYATISQAKYSGLRIVMVIEPDSLPNLITNLSFTKCSEAKSTGAYVQGVQYAIGTLRSISNTYAYVDVAHAAWLGWENSNMIPFVTLIKDMAAGIPGGAGKIDGFISNTANYNPVDEPFMDANTMIGSNPVRSLTSWYDWNDHIDELTYVAALKTKLTSGTGALPTTIGMVVDTSRNGWGGANRPTAASTSTDLKTFVMASRIDLRTHKGNWCNQSGAGIGERPQANPISGIIAYVWVKPPGESDGSSSLIPTGPDNPGGKGFDRMCDPTYTGNSLNGNTLTNALPNAPVSGRWFEAQFEELVQNAYPSFVP